MTRHLVTVIYWLKTGWLGLEPLFVKLLNVTRVVLMTHEIWVNNYEEVPNG